MHKAKLPDALPGFTENSWDSLSLEIHSETGKGQGPQSPSIYRFREVPMAFHQTLKHEGLPKGPRLFELFLESRLDGHRF